MSLSIALSWWCFTISILSNLLALPCLTTVPSQASYSLRFRFTRSSIPNAVLKSITDRFDKSP